MIKEGKFGPSEATWLIIVAICAKLFYTSPSMVSSLVGTASWYMTLISALVAAICFTFIYQLLKRFPNKDIIEIFKISMGSAIGFIFSAVFAILMLVIAGIRAREFTEVLKVFILPLTPTPVILVLFFAAVAVLNILGIETVARLAKLTSYAMLAGFSLVIIAGQQNYRFHRLFPILGYGIGKTIYNGVVRSSVYGEVIILAVIAGSLQGVKYIKKAGFTGIALSSLFISIALLAFILTFPYYIAMEITSPMYEMVTLIDYGRYFQRIDPVFLFIMGISSIISVAAVFYVFVSIYCKLFNISDSKPVILAASIVAFTLAVKQKSSVDVIFGSVQSIRDYGGLFFYIPPIIAYVTAVLRKKGQRKKVSTSDT